MDRLIVGKGGQEVEAKGATSLSKSAGIIA
mgnify:CR=1 FL=1